MIVRIGIQGGADENGHISKNIVGIVITDNVASTTVICIDYAATGNLNRF